MARLLIFIFIVLYIGGCSAKKPNYTKENYEKSLNMLIGFHSDVLFKVGQPDSSYKLADGSWVYEYNETWLNTYGGGTRLVPKTTLHSGTISTSSSGTFGQANYSGTSTSYVAVTEPVGIKENWCRTILFADRNRIITSWKIFGNNCVGPEPPKFPPYKYEQQARTIKFNKINENETKEDFVINTHTNMSLFDRPSFASSEVGKIEGVVPLKVIEAKHDKLVRVESPNGIQGWIPLVWTK
jgi:hypothetical protein